MKGLINHEKKVVQFVDGKPEASEEPTLFDDNATEESLIKGGLDLDGLQLVSLDVIIEKPKPKYVPITE